MTDEEFAAYTARSIAAHAEASVSAGRWPADEAPARAAEQFAELLPDGVATEGMILLTAEDDVGVPVGTVWLGLSHPSDLPGTGYLWDISVDPARRGLGFGRSLLIAGEDLLRSQGVTTVALNVFGDNETARRLYATNGYRTVSQVMHKAL
jgi:ribosomal protein S18 acetylase RimI-like enzyme